VKLWLLMIVALILFLVSCQPAITQADLEQAKQVGYEEGYVDGAQKAAENSYIKGYEEAQKEYDSQISENYELAYNEGFDAGYVEGFEEGLNQIQELSDNTPKDEYTESEQESPKINDSNDSFEDLAYIKAMPWPYSDDADPEYEGIKIVLSFYDSKSELITPDETIEVKIELCWYSNKGPVYDKKVTVAYSGQITDLMKEIIRIPFDVLPERPTGCTRSPILNVSVYTASNGKYEDLDNTSYYWP